MRAAPSSMEYSVCTCRWTKLWSEAGWDDIGQESMPLERQSLYAVPSPPEVSRTAAGLAADAVQSGLQIGGVGAAEVDPLTAAGVHEPEADGVQPLAFETKLLGKRWVRAVGQVTDAGMTQGGEVNPD